MDLIEMVWHVLGGDDVPSTGLRLALFFGYLAGAVMTLCWVKSRVAPEFGEALRKFQLTVHDRDGDRSPLDVAATHLLVQFVIGMGARPESHATLLNLDGDRCERPRRRGRGSRFAIALGLVFGRNETSEFADVTAGKPPLSSRLLHFAESLGIFVLASVLVIDGLIVLPWNLLMNGRIEGRAVTFLILAHGFMQLLGRVHRAQRAVELTTGLIRPTIVLLFGLQGLILFDLPTVVAGAQVAYLAAWLVALASVACLLAQATYAALRRPHDERQVTIAVLLIRVGAVTSFAAFAAANAAAIPSASGIGSLEYSLFFLAHSVSAVAIGCGQQRRRRGQPKRTLS